MAKAGLQERRRQELLDAFVTHLKFSENLSERSIIQYKCVIRRFLRYSLDRKGWQQYLSSIADKAPATKACYLVMVRKFLRWCHEERYIRTRSRWWENTKAPRFRSLPHYLTEEELERFLSAVDDTYYYALFRFLVNTGLRISEWVALKASDISIENGNAVLRVHGKGAKQRVLIIDKQIVDMAETAGILGRKVHPSTVFRRMKKYLRRAGIDKQASPHTLRHTFAILALRKGMPLNELQYVLGHSSIKTTSIYLQITGLERKVPVIL